MPTETQKSLLTNADQEQIVDAMQVITTGDIRGLEDIFPKVRAGENPATDQLFWRLQAARQLVDDYSKKLNKEGFNPRAKLVGSFRKEIDDLIKLSGEKRIADIEYSEGKRVFVPVFDKGGVTTTIGQEKFFEPGKVERMFQGTERAQTFGRRVDKMQQYLDEIGLPFDPEIKSEFFKQFGDVKTTAANRRLIQSMKTQGGPSAQAIEALAGQKAKNIVQEIIIRPSAVLQKIDEEIARKGGTFTEKELRDLSKWRSAFDQLSKDAAKGILPSNAWGLGLSFAASKLGTEFIKKQLQGTGE